MPFCTKCGSEVQSTDLFCSRCGARQAEAAPRVKDPFENVPARKAGVLCYIPFVGWIASIIVLASPRFREDRIVRFHAFQGLYLFVAWLILRWAFGWILWGPARHLPVVPILQFGLIFVWVFMLIKTSRDEVYSLPIVGELAERSLSEL
ncbi:MAG: zinc-ribbon domain-containing protein [bacterium]|jgi:uncharacterized membrane protein